MSGDRTTDEMNEALFAADVNDVDDFLPVETDGVDDEASGLEMDREQSEEIEQVFLSTLPQYLEPVEQMVNELFSADSGGEETHQALTATLASLSAAEWTVATLGPT